MMLTAAVFLFMGNACAMSKPHNQSPGPKPATITVNGIDFVRLPAGTFQMGDARVPNAVPVHSVTIKPFWMSKYEITNIQFEQFKNRPRPIESLKDSQPVTRIDWKDADQFCKWFSKKAKKAVRLPAEAEWEYAARGGLVGMDWPWGNDGPRDRANFFNHVTMTVGSFPPNNFGLYDMAGNVQEYVSGIYTTDYSKKNKSNTPSDNWEDFHIARGGFFSVFEGYVWQRTPKPDMPPRIDRPSDEWQSDGTGFRIVMDDAPSKAKTKNLR
jgi:formylglycine-generating enzyme required for sulfatase activity